MQTAYQNFEKKSDETSDVTIRQCEAERKTAPQSELSKFQEVGPETVSWHV